jgi:hypothetical protein
MKEILVMHILKGHPLITHGVFHMGATNEVLLVMGFYEKFFGECNGEHILLRRRRHFHRDICNAVFPCMDSHHHIDML